MVSCLATCSKIVRNLDQRELPSVETRGPRAVATRWSRYLTIIYVPETPGSKPSGIQLRYSKTPESRLKRTWSPEFSASSTSALAGVVTSANPESGMAGEMVCLASKVEGGEELAVGALYLWIPTKV